MSMYRRQSGEVHGCNWYTPNVKKSNEFPHVAFHANWWKTKGSKNATDVVVVQRSHCPKCGSSRRSEYWGRMVQKCAGLRPDGTPYTAIVRRRCRCLDCGQVRIDKEHA